jgi:heme-degrading monooxygenase HmoA
VQRQPGFAGLHILADRQTGKTLAISFWETEAALRAWEQMRGPIVAEQEATTGRTEQEGGSYEVVFNSKTHRTCRSERR